MSDKQDSSALEQAPEHIKLAVDLIYLLESNEISTELAIKAIDIVREDLQQKLNDK